MFTFYQVIIVQIDWFEHFHNYCLYDSIVKEILGVLKLGSLFVWLTALKVALERAGVRVKHYSLSGA